MRKDKTHKILKQISISIITATYILNIFFMIHNDRRMNSSECTKYPRSTEFLKFIQDLHPKFKARISTLHLITIGPCIPYALAQFSDTDTPTVIAAAATLSQFARFNSLFYFSTITIADKLCIHDQVYYYNTDNNNFLDICRLLIKLVEHPVHVCSPLLGSHYGYAQQKVSN